jgi:hypothetical protein
MNAFFGGWLGLPFPLFDGAVPASLLAFGVGFAGYLGLAAGGDAFSRSRPARQAEERRP